MKMVQINTANRKNEEEKVGDYSRNIRPQDIDDIDTQARFGEIETTNNPADLGDFRFDLQAISF